MNLDIKFTNLDLTPVIKEYIENKILPLSKFIEKWEKIGAVNAQFELARTTNHHRKGEVYYAEINIKLNGKTLRAEHSALDAYEAIDKAKDIIKESIIKLKEQN
ncbi:ribosome-associated translation inhibitor RaiA [Patescibacteria group bacterium]|nr:ribosome-associated translation inhibitor RaiA [Patescibacteria group bacterium]